MRGLLVKNVDSNHDYDPKNAFVAESWLLRAPDPLFKQEQEGAWAVGIKIDDDELWREVQSGGLKALSMAGTAVKVAKSDQSQQSEEDQSILKRLAKAIKNLMNHKEEEEMTKEEIQKCVDAAVAPLKDAIEKAPKPHDEEALAKIIKAAVDEVLKPVLDRLEKVEKSTSGSKQNEENINKDDDPIAIGKRIAKMIKGE
jgi:acetyl-CoA acetyltransferase